MLTLIRILAVSLLVRYALRALPGVRRRWAQRTRRVRGTTALLDTANFAQLWAAALSATASPAAALDAIEPSALRSLALCIARGRRRARLGEPVIGALRREATRARIEPLASLCARIERSAALGLPAGQALVALAAEFHSRAYSARLQRAGRAVPLATLVSALVIAPACVLVLGVLMVGGGLGSLTAG